MLHAIEKASMHVVVILIEIKLKIWRHDFPKVKLDPHDFPKVKLDPYCTFMVFLYLLSYIYDRYVIPNSLRKHHPVTCD